MISASPFWRCVVRRGHSCVSTGTHCSVWGAGERLDAAVSLSVHAWTDYDRCSHRGLLGNAGRCDVDDGFRGAFLLGIAGCSYEWQGETALRFCVDCGYGTRG